MSQVVLFDVVDTRQSYQIGVATLNQPKVLNGFSLDMAVLLQKQLIQWENDPTIVAVMLKGAGDKAFCAGGDLHGLYQAMLGNQQGSAWSNRLARDFFATEYRLDYHIHTYTKPIICFGDGIVMGGGMGLMMGASHRVVTETTRIAMPEISIGLFPDVGGSWMLNRLPGNTGKFLAATAAQIGALDAVFTQMANYYVDRTDWQEIEKKLGELPWQSSQHRHINDDLIHSVLAAYPGKTLKGKGPLETHYALINHLGHSSDYQRYYNEVAALVNHEDAWLARAAQAMQKGAPLSFALAMELLRTTKHLSLADVFRLEFNAAMHACIQGQFQEGIRALLIDKDKHPQWQPCSLSEVAQHDIEAFYQDPTPAGEEHPLATL